MKTRKYSPPILKIADNLLTVELFFKHETRLDVYKLLLYTFCMYKFGFTALLITISLFLSGCLSSFFKEPKPTFSSEIILSQPPTSFQKLEGLVYPSWKKAETGQVLSIVSDCSETKPDLFSIHSLISGSLDKVKVQNEKATSEFSQFKAYTKSLKGELDGKPIEVLSYSFETKNCTYLASLVGKPDTIKTEISIFKKFLSELSFKK